MGNFKIGADADHFGDEEVSEQKNKFTSLSSGTTLPVKVIDPNAKMSYFGYGMFKPQVYTFAAKNPSKKSAKGYPVEDLTPWDKAWKYHADKSEKFQDKHSQEAYKYSPKKRGAFGFYDLTTGEQIIVDFTKKQAEGIQASIDKYKSTLDRLPLELAKVGEGKSTAVTLAPIALPEEYLTDKQRENFANAPEEFDLSNFEGIVYEMPEDEQIETLQRVGFDTKLIGYNQSDVSKDTNEDVSPISDAVEPANIKDEDLPF